MAGLRLGPMLRYVSESEATIWVETDAACEVEICGHRTRTFCVEGNHYALVIIEGLAPGETIEYQVALDGEVRWPEPGSRLPPSVIRTSRHDGGRKVLFGSCRAAAPHEPPWSLELAFDDRGRGVDALRAHALRMLDQSPDEWPDLAVMLGDQVYADDSSPETHERIRERRRANGDELDDRVADFTEYCWLYHESWEPEIERWFFSVVPTAMIFDDHDMVDDWNISDAWVRDIRQDPWWGPHVVGGLMSYWIYQHLGNLSPDDIRREGMLAALLAETDGADYLRDWALRSEEFTPVPGGYRFSYTRELGSVRLVVADARNGRVLEPGNRAMLDEEEMSWIEELCVKPASHLILATSLPVYVPGGLHDIQVWNEAVCDGAWGRLAARVGERLRRALDLEDWPAFSASFERLSAVLANTARAEDAPASITILSGDIHFSYVAEVDLSGDGNAGAVTSAVHQVVSSPMRNALPPRDRTVLRFAMSRIGRRIARSIRGLARRPTARARWEMTDGPVFANTVGQLLLDDRSARLLIEQARADDDGEPILHVAVDTRLA